MGVKTHPNGTGGYRKKTASEGRLHPAGRLAIRYTFEDADVDPKRHSDAHVLRYCFERNPDPSGNVCSLSKL